MTTASLIVSFYNDAQALGLILAALEDQSCRPLEVIIADDGSASDAVAAAEQAMARSSLHVARVWHADRGFAKTTILNQAVRRCRGDSLLFIDGDCIPQRHFVEDHLAHSRPGTCLAGRRACLSRQASERLRRSRRPARFVSEQGWRLLFDYLRRRGRNIEKGFRLRHPLLRRLLSSPQSQLTGCNFSLQRQDLLAVNGFDERYNHPGIGEDSDLEWRLRRAGVTIEAIPFLATMLHLQHPKLPPSGDNRELFAAVVASGSAWTPYGIERRAAP